MVAGYNHAALTALDALPAELGAPRSRSGETEAETDAFLPAIRGRVP
jgi:hypothetical protein